MTYSRLKIFFFLIVIFLKSVFCYTISTNETTGNIDIKMPNSKPSQPETYFCTPMKLDEEKTIYITGFEPKADRKTAHHILLYGCKTPGKNDELFNCGAMAAKQKGIKSALNPCGSGPALIYAWAQNAPNFNLPKDVAFRVGGPDSGINWLVLQVHYASVDYIPEDGDTSGVLLHYTTEPQPKSAGVYFTATLGTFPAGQTTKTEAACKLSTDQVLHPFAFRVHTHAFGTVVSGWKVSPDMSWTLLGKDDPQLPQMFNPIANPDTTLTKGDTVASRCTIVNTSSRDVHVGPTRDDEMCNFYVMYWVEGKTLPSEFLCETLGPPYYTWDGWIFGGGLKNIPDKDASTYDD